VYYVNTVENMPVALSIRRPLLIAGIMGYCDRRMQSRQPGRRPLRISCGKKNERKKKVVEKKIQHFFFSDIQDPYTSSLQKHVCGADCTATVGVRTAIVKYSRGDRLTPRTCLCSDHRRAKRPRPTEKKKKK
jgi:hypothetical protein